MLLIAGIAGLWLGTELTISGAIAIARRAHLSEFFVGLVILSVGSDLPELAIAIDAGIKGLVGIDASGVVVGTSIGSLVAQIGFVLGIGGIITRLTLPRRFVLRHGAALLGATLLLFAVALDGHISRFEGLALVAFYLLYVTTLTNGETGSDEQPATSADGGIRSWAGLIIGLGVVIGSSEITVNAVVSIAYALDISEALISVLIIGLGTSLPELSISIAAILKNRSALSVGNIIGSNILDTLLPIGLASLISTVSFERQLLFFDLPFIFVLTSVVLGLFLLRRGVRRPQGIVILGFYAGYVLFKLSQI